MPVLHVGDEFGLRVAATELTQPLVDERRLGGTATGRVDHESHLCCVVWCGVMCVVWCGCGVWCVVCGVVCGVWCAVCGVRAVCGVCWCVCVCVCWCACGVCACVRVCCVCCVCCVYRAVRTARQRVARKARVSTAS